MTTINTSYNINVFQNIQTLNISQNQAQFAAGLLSQDTFGPSPATRFAQATPFFFPPPGYSDMALSSAMSSLLSGGLFGQMGIGKGMGDFGMLGAFGPMCMCMCHHHHGVMPMSLGNFQRVQQADGTDKFATHQSCRTGRDNPSNLNNSDHIKLALYDLLNKQETTRGGFKSFQNPEDLAKKLKDEYGIKAEVTTVKSKEGDELKALKFENGAVFADGAGDGQLDMGDYNFKGAIEDIEKRYGAKADDLIGAMKETKQASDKSPFLQSFGIENAYQSALSSEGQSQQLLKMYSGGLEAVTQDPTLGALASQLQGLGSPMFPSQSILSLFAQAYMLSGMGMGQGQGQLGYA
ncbi:MAG: hypothetical protein HY791_23760 [Deltaproteobacteria bacterium]|nr:hypothetical protein [Deltaproteobacteria bacterium]